MLGQRFEEQWSGADKNVGSGDKYASVLKLMQFIGTVYGGASVAQVALNYLRAKGGPLARLYQEFAGDAQR